MIQQTTFDDAVQAIISGDTTALKAILQTNPHLIHEHAPSEHQATLLHYIAVNGVEDSLQKSPSNAVEIAQILLEAGAEVDALSTSYGDSANETTLCLLVSSYHPAAAGVQADLVKVLCDAGAKVDGLNNDGAPAKTALAFWYPAAFDMIVQCGARLDNVIFAAAAGRLDLVKEYFDADTLEPVDLMIFPDDKEAQFSTRERILGQALVKACLNNQIEIVAYLLQNGVDINSRPYRNLTGLHEAAWAGQFDMVTYLVEHGANITLRDTQHNSIPAEWAAAAKHNTIADYLNQL